MASKKTVFVFILFSFLLIGCMYYRVENGILRDTLFSVEKTYGGAYRIWVTHDDVSGYCTFDKEIGEKAYQALLEHDGEVLISFRSINETDKEWSLWNSSDCKTTEGVTKMWLIQSVELVSSR